MQGKCCSADYGPPSRCPSTISSTSIRSSLGRLWGSIYHCPGSRKTTTETLVVSIHPGYTLEIVSDRGTNFIGADRELHELVKRLKTSKIQDQTVNKIVKWSFNPPLAPHFGGVHKVMIKAAKKAIRAILGNADVNDEELMTAFTGVEALLNSCPLTYQSADPKDVTAFNPKKRCRRVQELVSHF